MASPYELLIGLALLRERKRQLEADQQQGPIQAWSALVVKIGSWRCVMRQDEVDEVIAPSKLTKVLGTPNWMLGIGYFRNQLLNVLDGRMLFLGRSNGSVNQLSARILVVQGQEEWFGIKVDELIGIRHIWSDSAEIKALTDKLSIWRSFATQCIVMNGEVMPILQARALMRGLEQQCSPELSAVAV
ncbi:chemotaxis protein CheW [uncultured Thiothrix sp.]|jgi:chemotaxis signal transduction protein|uniref:chemotaxis protein CheW n=1 Tax=uncultured Thiothrix sp. TaxID=223185 RepID=UPI002638BFD2|nr:chemotaxis protein CheW [uncultured Thiothrix sp.]HMT93359.1 chemotaxis protein CheW [Thiolinea sp.]